MKTAQECLSLFAGRELDEEAREYLQFHCERYAILLSLAGRLVGSGPGLRILDIGMSFQTELLRAAFPGAIVNTLGFLDDRHTYGATPHSQHWHFDLNDVYFPEKWVETGRHNLVVFAEVLEHLYTSPKLVLRFLRTTVKEGGYLLIQTPNAASLMKRRKLVSGNNPYEMIRETRINPGHFREYTHKELEPLAGETGFEVCETLILNYFSYPDAWGKVYKAICDRLPANFRDGITMALRAVPEASGTGDETMRR